VVLISARGFDFGEWLLRRDDLAAERLTFDGNQTAGGVALFIGEAIAASKTRHRTGARRCYQQTANFTVAGINCDFPVKA